MLEARNTFTPESAPHRRAIVLAEPNALTRWSVSTFLQRWFEVKPASAASAVEQHLRAGQVAALVLSDQIPTGVLERLVRRARRLDPGIVAILMVTGADTNLPEVPVQRIEKPFPLPDLARLLGVPDAELLTA